jgi:hypothetical protein
MSPANELPLLVLRDSDALAVGSFPPLLFRVLLLLLLLLLLVDE